MKNEKLEYLTPTAELVGLGDDVITTSREWDTEEMPITPQQSASEFAW